MILCLFLPIIKSLCLCEAVQQMKRTVTSWEKDEEELLMGNYSFFLSTCDVLKISVSCLMLCFVNQIPNSTGTMESQDYKTWLEEKILIKPKSSNQFSLKFRKKTDFDRCWIKPKEKKNVRSCLLIWKLGNIKVNVSRATVTYYVKSFTTMKKLLL